VKILALRGKNIASLLEFEVDFQAEPLASAGVFAIVGPTGSGKSSLLDALCLSLYLNAPRLDDLGREAKVASGFGEITQSDIKNLLRRGTSIGFCECDFLSGDGEAYRAHWGLRAAKRTGAAPQEETSLVRLSDAAILVNNRKLEYLHLVEEKIGLSYAQFIRTVLLAQGRFAQFLRSGEDERADLLEKLTGTELYRKISCRVHERKSAACEARDAVLSQKKALPELSEEEQFAKKARLGELSTLLTETEKKREALRALLGLLSRLEELGRQRQELENHERAAQPRLAELRDDMALRETELQRLQKEREDTLPQLEAARLLDTRLHASRELLEERAREHARRQQALSALTSERSKLEERAAHEQAEIVQLEIWLTKNGEKLGPLSGDWPRWHQLLRRLAEDLAQLAAAQKRLTTAQAERSCALESLQVVEQKVQALGNTDIPSESELPGRLEALRARLETLRVLPARLRLENEELATLTKIREEEAREPQLREACAAADAAWETARRFLETTHAALSGDVTHLRSGLSPEVPCPVCGSLEHPWAETAPVLEGLLAIQEGEEREARKRRDQASALRERNRTAHALCEESLSELRAKLRQTPADPELLSRARESGDPLGWASQALEEARVQEQRWERAAHGQTELKAARATLATQEALLLQTQGEASRLEEATESAQEALDLPFQGRTWRENFLSRPDFAEATNMAVGKFLSSREERAAREQAHRSTLEALERKRQELDQREKEAAQGESLLSTAQEELTDLQMQRRALLSGRPVAEVESAMGKGADEARKRLEEAQAGLQAQERERLQRQGRLAQLHGQEEEGQLQLAIQRQQILAEIGDEELATAVQQRLESLQEQLAEEQSEAARLALELENDRRDRKQGQELSRILEELQTDLDAWDLLDTKIGSANGKKFSRLAQSHTLEILLEEANRRMALIAPRYSLEAIPGSMGLLVVDHESYDELRPVHTLSGGESFLVSLGLALGLSHMAGGDLSVETLFIDEGFGTLDSESLRHVLSALGSLQAQGRKVGLITHVEEMKAEIPVHIEVLPLGQGASRVRVVG